MQSVQKDPRAAEAEYVLYKLAVREEGHLAGKGRTIAPDQLAYFV